MSVLNICLFSFKESPENDVLEQKDRESMIQVKDGNEEQLVSS